MINEVSGYGSAAHLKCEKCGNELSSFGHRDACVMPGGSEFDGMKAQKAEMERAENERLYAIERQRWVGALRELGFTVAPGVGVKENLYDFAEWWRRQVEKEERNHGQVDE